MLTDEHAFRLGLFREHPDLAPLLLEQPLKTPLPAYSKIAVVNATFPQPRPTEYHADLLILLEDAEAQPVLSIIVEVQLRPDPDKERVWPYYVASAFKDRCCPVVLLVLAQDQPTANWARKRIRLGPGGSQVVPRVAGPRQIPRIKTEEAAQQSPALAVLSALAHAPEPKSAQIVWAGLKALNGGSFEAGTVRFLGDFILAKMDSAARAALRRLEDQMKIEGYQYKSDFARQYVAEGKAEGVAGVLLRLFEKRHLAVSPTQAERIRTCRDEQQLLTWFDRALTAESITEVLDT